MPALTSISTPDGSHDDFNKSTSAENLSTEQLWSRYAQFEGLDAIRNKILKDTITELEKSRQQNLFLQQEIQCQRALTQTYQTRTEENDSRLEQMQQWILSKAFVLVLIDGDGMLFEDSLVKAGHMGGKLAADRLQEAASLYMADRMPSLPNGVQVVARVFADLRALASLYVQAGVAETTRTVQEFFQSFTTSQPWFEFIDTGSNDPDGLFNKIADTFFFFEDNAHCQQVLLGCSHNDAYTRLFEDVPHDQRIGKVTLLEGLPFGEAYHNLPFTTHEIEGLFRKTKLTPKKAANPFAAPFTPSPKARQASLSIRTMSPLSKVSEPPSAVATSPSPTAASWVAVGSSTPRTASISSEATSLSTYMTPPTVSATPAPPPAMSWASAVLKPAPPSPAPTSTPPPTLIRNSTPGIPRNKAGQRLDPATIPYSKPDVDRVKKLKMCNVHYLQQKCPYGDKCSHVHSYKPTKEELGWLRLVARMAPCRMGSACEEVGCIYGHRCPAPEGREKGKRCIFGEECRFPKELHGGDTLVVKYVTVK